MTNKQILQPDLLDIIFEHRNKAYGAYALRRSYNKRLLKALITAFTLAGLFVFLSSLRTKNSNRHRVEIKEDVILTQVNLEKEKPAEPEPQPKPQKKQPLMQRNFQTIVVVPDKEVKKPIVDLSELDYAQIGNADVDGTLDTGLAKKPGEANGAGDAAATRQAEKEPEVMGPSFVPSFPGGMNGLANFLRKNLRTPDELNPGDKITVLIKFLVDKDGTISDFKIVQSGGRQLDEEVIRVVRKMPAWNPGKQNGKPISMYFTQPVTFMGEEG